MRALIVVSTIRLTDGTEITPQLNNATPATYNGEIYLKDDASPVCTITSESITKR